MNIDHSQRVSSLAHCVMSRTDNIAAPVSTAALANPATKAEVSISGRALLLQRVFDVKDPAMEPPVKSRDAPGSFFMPDHLFLTHDDRDLLARIYEFAHEQHADLRFVDNLIFSLSGYRFHRDGRTIGAHNEGHFDLEGHQVTCHFTDRDAATAKRILASEALHTTELDKGFLLRITNEDYSGINHCNFDFLEQVIHRFSAKGTDMSPLGEAFFRYEPIYNNYIKRVSVDRKVEPCGEDHFAIKTGHAKDEEPHSTYILTPLQRVDAHRGTDKVAARSLYATLFDVLARFKP